MSDRRWGAWVIAGVLLGLTVIFAINYWIVAPIAAEMKVQQKAEIQERSDVGWEDVGTQRCYWRKVEPERRICVPPEDR